MWRTASLITVYVGASVIVFYKLSIQLSSHKRAIKLIIGVRLSATYSNVVWQVDQVSINPNCNAVWEPTSEQKNKACNGTQAYRKQDE